MKSFLVIGMGRFGTAVAQELTELGQEVLAIDENVESVQRIADDVTQVMRTARTGTSSSRSACATSTAVLLR